jgi:hypothetical protein
MCMVSIRFKFLYLDAVRTGTLVLNCHAIPVAPTPALLKEDATFIRIWMILERKKMVICPDRTRIQERLCWGRPAEAYCYARTLKEICYQGRDSFRAATQKNIVMRPAGSGTKNDCAGEGLQKFARQNDRPGAVEQRKQKREFPLLEAVTKQWVHEDTAGWKEFEYAVPISRLCRPMKLL